MKSGALNFSLNAETTYKKFLMNTIYKLLLIREGDKDWTGYLDSLLLEIQGFTNIFDEIEELDMIRLLSKLEGLRKLSQDSDFYLYRKTIFECINLFK